MGHFVGSGDGASFAGDCLGKRYRACLKVDSLREHTGVVIQLFHYFPTGQGFTDDLYQDILNCLDWRDSYLQSAAEETFDIAEVAALRKWFEGFPGVHFDSREADPIAANQMGAGRLPFGGAQGYLEFEGMEGFPLSCQVHGHYDLRFAKSGPYLGNENLSLMRLHVGEDGTVVVKQPPF